MYLCVFSVIASHLPCSTFDRNRGDGALATEYSHMEFRGHNQFMNNIGTSTEVHKCINHKAFHLQLQ